MRERKTPAWHKEMIATVSKKASVAGKDSSCQESESLDSEIPDDKFENGGDAVEIEEENIEGGKSEDEEEGTEKGKRRGRRQDSQEKSQSRERL